MSPEPPKPAKRERTFITLDPSVTKVFAGTYPLPKIGQTLVVEAADGKLRAGGPIQPPLDMKPMTQSSFYVEQLQADVEFTPAPNGGMKVKITQPGGAVEGERSNNAPVKDTSLASFSGVYWSEELETRYTVSIDKGKLIATHAHHGVIALTPVTNDTFRGSQWFMSEVNFTRDAEGHITGMRLGGGRLRGILFVRKSS